MSAERPPVTSASWQAYPSPIDFGSVYLCADEKGVMFKRMLTAGNAKDSPFWGQVAWVLPALDIPRPGIPPVDKQTIHV